MLEKTLRQVDAFGSMEVSIMDEDFIIRVKNADFSQPIPEGWKFISESDEWVFYTQGSQLDNHIAIFLLK
jgi:hypothetical protein